MSPVAAAHAQRRSDVLVCVGIFALLLLWDLSGLDMVAMRALGGPLGFTWREHWVTTIVLHQGGRALGWVVFIALLLQLWRPLPFARDLGRADRGWWLVTCLLCLLVIPLLKHASLSSCPWSLAEFGGSARYVSHWLWGTPDGGGGGCFPSGHASAAFAFLAGHFALRERHPQAARCWLIGVLALGLLFGVGQTLRGAHYPSHTLWTAWICLVLTLASHHLWQAMRQH